MLYIIIYIVSEVGPGVQPGKCFVSFVRAYARFVCIVGTGQKSLSPPFPFSFLCAGRFPFSLGRWAPPPSPTNLLSNFSWPYR